MDRLVAVAREKLDHINRNEYGYPDDDIMLVPRGGDPGACPGEADARLFVTEPDIAAINSTSRPASRVIRIFGFGCYWPYRCALPTFARWPPRDFRPGSSHHGKGMRRAGKLRKSILFG
jgi:hypothetical protein